MMFWMAAAALAAAVTYAVTRPLVVSGADAEMRDVDASAADVAVYKDQLREIEAEVQRGAISAVDGEAARNEVARRMIRASDVSETAPISAASHTNALRWTYLAASVALPLVSLGLYLNFGAPGLPAQPLSARLQGPPNAGNANDMVAKVEAALRANPDDGKGWDVIAPVYMAQARFADAADAYASAMRMLGESAARLQGFSDARIRAENGLIPADARQTLQRLRKLEPDRIEPRIWLALAKEQDGDAIAAASEYRAILAGSAADAPWRSMLEARLASLHGPPSSGATDGRGPAPSDVAAFEAMTPEQRQAKISEMVDGLAARLKSQPNDLTGWQKLIRAYAALGRKDDALKAATDARAGLSGDKTQIEQFETWMKQLGLAG